MNGNGMAQAVDASFPEKKTDEVIQQIDENKAQIMWQGDTCIIVLPTHKIERLVARGILREAEDAVCIHYMKAQQRKKMIMEPSHNLRNKLAKLNPFS